MAVAVRTSDPLELKACRLAARAFAHYRATARPEVDITRDINRHAERRVNVYRELAELGAREPLREELAMLNRRIDFLYEELRITRMVTA